MDYPEILAKNLLEDCTFTYDQAEDPVYKPEYLGDRSRMSKFRGANATPQHVTFDLGSAKSVDTVVLDKGFVVSGAFSQALIQHYSDDAQWPSGGSWVTDLTMTKAGDLADNTLPLWKKITSVSRRYWRLRLTGLDAAPHIFNLWLGQRIELTFFPTGNFDPWKEQSVDQLETGVSGGMQNVHRYSGRLLDAPFDNLLDPQVDQVDAWWSGAGRHGKAWWFLWQPDAYQGSPVAMYAPVYIISPNMVRDFPMYRAIRSGALTGQEML